MLYLKRIQKIIIILIAVLFAYYGFIWALQDPVFCEHGECVEITE